MNKPTHDRMMKEAYTVVQHAQEKLIEAKRRLNEVIKLDPCCRTIYSIVGDEPQ